MSTSSSMKMLQQVSDIIERVSKDANLLEADIMELCEMLLDDEEKAFWDGFVAGYDAGSESAQDRPRGRKVS